MGINPWRSQKRATNHKPKNKNKKFYTGNKQKNKKNSNTKPATNKNKKQTKAFDKKMKTTTERATPVPTLVLMKARHLCGESRGASSPKSNQSKQVQVTSLACVPDRCQATQKDTNPRGDHEPTTMTSLHPVTLLTNFALNFAYIKT